MFLFSIPDLSYTHPWSSSLEDRLAALNARERRVAYYYEAPDTSTFRYRVFNMVDALNSARDFDISASWFSHADLESTSRFVDEAHALVICRTRYNALVGRMIARAKARRIPLFFDIDDLVFDPRYIHLVLDALDQDTESDEVWHQWFADVGRVGATLQLCDAAITTNQYLADRIASFVPGMSVSIIPNFLNRAQQRESNRIWRAKIESGFLRDEKIHIGYFSGTPTHNHDFRIVASALTRLLKEDGRIVVHVVGFAGSKAAMLEHPDRVEFSPLQDFINLQRLVGRVEINIAPVQNTVFSNCKSELKYFEAAIVGTLTVASPTFTFRNVIEDGRNGFLAGAHEWEAKLRTALEAVNKTDAYAAMVDSARQHSEKCYGWDRQARRIASVIFGARQGSAISRAANPAPSPRRTSVQPA